MKRLWRSLIVTLVVATMVLAMLPGSVSQANILGLKPDSEQDIREAPLPLSVDNSISPAFPPIGDQGTLNSCIAWATTYYQLSYEYSLASGNNTVFSPKWTYNLINGGKGEYTTYSDAYTVLQKNGAATWTDFPYDSNFTEWSLNPTVWRKALNYRITSTEQVYDPDINTLIQNMKTQLAEKHVVTIMTYVFSWVSTNIQDSPYTPGQDPYIGQYIAAYMSGSQLQKHAMTVVGYNDDIWADLNGNSALDYGETGAFKVANSKGLQDWNSGFRWVAYDALRKNSAVRDFDPIWPPVARSAEGIFLPDNVYVMKTRAGYSPTMVAELSLNHAKRGQLAVNLGISQSPAPAPSSTWDTAALNKAEATWLSTEPIRPGTERLSRFQRSAAPTSGKLAGG
jgi:hypothetical protein